MIPLSISAISELPPLELEVSLLDESSLVLLVEVVELLDVVDVELVVEEVLEVVVLDDPELLTAVGVLLPPPPPPQPLRVMIQEADRIRAIFEVVIFSPNQKKEPTSRSVLLSVNFKNDSTLMQTRVILN